MVQRMFEIIPFVPSTVPMVGMNPGLKTGIGEVEVGVREYRPGDDVRKIKEAARARDPERRLRVAVTRADLTIHVAIVVDSTSSMTAFRGEVTGFDKPQAALGAVNALAGAIGRQRCPWAFVATESTKEPVWSELRPAQDARRIQDACEQLTFTADASALAVTLDALMRSGSRVPPGTVVFIITDGGSLVEADEPLRRLRRRGYDIVTVLVRHPMLETTFPDGSGDADASWLRVPIDGIGGIPLTRGDVKAFREANEAHHAALKEMIRKNRFSLVEIESDEPLGIHRAFMKLEGRRRRGRR